MNGTLVSESSWDGKKARKLEAELLPGVLREGANVLELENVGDTEARYSLVMLDRYEVDYPRFSLAEGNELHGTWRQTGSAEVPAVSPGIVLDVTGPSPRWLEGVESLEDGTLRFRADAGQSYRVVGLEAVKRAEIRRPKQTRLKSTRNRADYVVIGPQAFLEAAAPLIQLRRSQGLLVEAVSTEAIYEAFGYGERRPEAIMEFLAYAYHRWRRPSLRYVVLVGDASYDFKDLLGTGVKNHVPPLMVRTSYLWTASDPAYAAVNGEDLLPDIAIGRLPAATVGEVRTMVDKILAYETGDAGLRDQLVLIADDADRAGDFEADADALASGVLSSHEVRKIYSSELGTAATRSAIVDSFDEGASLMSYMGHGGIHLWADENLFHIEQVGSLSPQAQQPLLLTMNCLNGYFHFPYFNSLAEELLKARDKGAIAAFSPSGLSLNGPARRFHQALLEQILHGGHERLGDAVLAAQQAYAETGALPELLSIYHLLGDPALVLR